MSQQEFAFALGISRSAYQNYERAEREVPSTVVCRIADKFNIDPVWLMFDDGDVRIIKRNRDIGAQYAMAFQYIEGRVSSLGRVITPDKKLMLAQQMEAEYLSRHKELDNLGPRERVIIENLIMSLSEAA